MTKKLKIVHLVDDRQYSKVRGFIERAEDQGLKSFTNTVKASDEGYFVPATVFYDVPDDAEIATKEIFGPVLSVLKPYFLL
jgi:acyl-CoA reductase-like NAD-dependent aldehyde dehydrogenase